MNAMFIHRDSNANPDITNPDLHKSYYKYQYDAAAYGDHIKNTACVCNLSASHTYGNVLSVVEQYILQSLPKDIFKTVTSSTTIAHKQIRHLPYQLQKREMPIFVTVPRIVFGQEENRFLANTIMNSRITNTEAVWGEGSLIPLAEDKHHKLYIHGHYNRAVMYVDVVCSFNTYSEQINFVSFLHNMLPIAHNKFIRAPLELYIPEEFCYLISNLVDIDFKNNGVYDFLTYMNSIFYHPITYKLKGGSNSDEFFLYYIADIDTLFSDVQFNTGVKDGQLKRNFDVTFTARCEFNTIGYFTLNSPNIQKPIVLQSDIDRSILPIFSDVINLDDFQLPVGWSLLCWPIFKLDLNENSISIDPILNDSIRACIKYHLEHGIPMDNFIQIQFRENGEILENELYNIDWLNRILILHAPDYHRTYRLIVSVSHEYINNLIKEVYDLE